MFWFVSAVGLETGSGRAGLFSHRAGPGWACIFLQCTGPGRAEPFSGRAGLDIFGPCRALIGIAHGGYSVLYSLSTLTSMDHFMGFQAKNSTGQ